MKRLHSQDDIASMFRTIKPKHTQFFQVYIKLSPQTIESRVGVIVPKKHIPLAVKRNRLKRKISEYIRKEYSKTTPICDILIVVKSQITQVNTRGLYADLHTIITLI
jgi:ribonuclease P protein component